MSKFLLQCTAAALVLTSGACWAQTFQTVHSFPADLSQGTKPVATLALGPDRALYGTTTEGGTDGSGTAFKFQTNGTFSTLGSFVVGTTGKTSRAQLVSLPDGFLYGATSFGTGTSGQPIGTVFKLNPAGGISSLFPVPGGGTDPKTPISLAFAETGVVHVLGTSPSGVWRVPTNGNTPTVAYNFPSSGDNGIAAQRILKASDGFLYGVTQGTGFVGDLPGRRGTIFRVLPDGTNFSVLHDCTYNTGVAPKGNLVEGSDGSFYGTMTAGGVHGDGVVFRITAQGNYTVLYSINDHTPTGDLLLASDGKLYGTSSVGGSNLTGSVFRLNTNGTGFQILYTFPRANALGGNGIYPESGLIQADDGNLYGVTSRGGTADQGTIFRIDLNLPTPPVNRPPVAVLDRAFSNGNVVDINVLKNDFDPDQDNLTVSIVTPPNVGTATVLPSGQIRYTPSAGQIPNGYQGSDQLTYRITDPDGLFSEATVLITDDPPVADWQPGTYNGVLNLDTNLTGSSTTPRAQLILTVGASGTFSGKLLGQGKKLTVRGLFTEDGYAVATVKIPKQKPAVLFLGAAEGGSLAAIFFGQEIWSGIVSPLRVPNPAVRSSHTLVLEKTDPLLPSGFGYGIARIYANGLVAIAGKNGDGTKVAWGSTLVNVAGQLAIPVYNEPLRGGYCGGYLAYDAGSNLFSGNLRWKRPAASRATLPYASGFTGQVTAFLAPFTVPARGAMPVNFGPDQAAALAIAGPTVSPAVGGTVTLQGTRYVASAPVRSFTINRNTGLFTGQIKVGTKYVKVNGAVLQAFQTGAGSYFVGGVSGVVEFDAD